MKGTILSQPQLSQNELTFILESNKTAIAVIRKNREDQKRDILFLCAGQQVILWGFITDDYVIADKIRIIDCGVRNYLFDIEQIEENSYGNSAFSRDDPGDS